LSVDKLLHETIDTLQAAFKADFVAIGLQETATRERQIVGALAGRSFDEAIPPLRTLTLHYDHTVIATDYLGAADQRLKQILDRNNIAVLVRLAPKVKNDHEALGYIAFGRKKSGNPYGSADFRVLDAVASELIIAIQNALHFEEIQNFNKTLQGKVEHATTELRKTNEKLKLLDQTKDEFITMASHQLRTPLTSIKGYLSMVLEGDAGKLTGPQRKMLEQSYASSQRMVYLISDLLNLSRLNTGKFVIESSPVNLAEVVRLEVDQLQETAKSRELTLVYHQPASFPALMLDETKIHQVVMNFIDNAIYYTPAGGTVTVGLRETPTAVEYTVTDTGIGVPKAVQHKLFTKFYRAANAQQARPDGTGLGLFMARKVVAAQGGSIIFESMEGKGSTFGFRFGKAAHAVPAEGADVSGAVGASGRFTAQNVSRK
jgi:signal transduction histidine kinase